MLLCYQLDNMGGGKVTSCVQGHMIPLGDRTSDLWREIGTQVTGHTGRHNYRCEGIACYVYPYQA